MIHRFNVMNILGAALLFAICCISLNTVGSTLSASRHTFIVDGRELWKGEWTYGCDDYCWSKKDCYIGYCYTFHPSEILTIDSYRWKCKEDSDCGALWECGSRPYFKHVCSPFGT